LDRIQTDLSVTPFFIRIDNRTLDEAAGHAAVHLAAAFKKWERMGRVENCSMVL
jgi:hypothetical protein